MYIPGFIPEFPKTDSNQFSALCLVHPIGSRDPPGVHRKCGRIASRRACCAVPLRCEHAERNGRWDVGLNGHLRQSEDKGQEVASNWGLNQKKMALIEG